jgi:hypothetical protein
MCIVWCLRTFVGPLKNNQLSSVNEQDYFMDPVEDSQKYDTCMQPGLPDFCWNSIPKRWRKYIKWSQNGHIGHKICIPKAVKIPNGYKIYVPTFSTPKRSEILPNSFFGMKIYHLATLHATWILLLCVDLKKLKRCTYNTIVPTYVQLLELALGYQFAIAK